MGAGSLWPVLSHLNSLSPFPVKTTFQGNLQLSLVQKQLPFLFLCILRDLPLQGNPRALGQQSSPKFICVHIPMGKIKSYEMGKKQENKKRVVYIRGGFHTCAFSLGCYPWAHVDMPFFTCCLVLFVLHQTPFASTPLAPSYLRISWHTWLVPKS